ncbi:glycosyltransferase family 4 protein [Meiothermus sp.]|uniref:glycosyltransferase family 4 protein n=1 Tax=Meiothermus sp. TaxID=1955249 RepID=UPI0021DE715A|nr:glycosyltransferase family 4 protein [Meiothermus sp.]GIW33099.1 MAG: glycosyltransferase WbuB [Meiothermus sp.]
MRFLFLTQYFPPEIGAAQVRLASVVRELVRLGHEVEVVTALPNYPTGRIFADYRGKFALEETWEGVRVQRTWLYPAMGTGVRRLLNYFSFAATSLWALLRARKPDFIFVESPPLFLSITAFLASRWFRVPFIFNVADLWPDSVRQLGLMKEGPLLRLAAGLERWSYQKATYVTAVTEGIQKILLTEKGLPSHKVVYLPNGVDTTLFRPLPPDQALAKELGLEGKKVILYAGNHGYAHGLEVALQAAQHLSNPDIVLVLIGDGSEKKRLMEMAQEMALRNVRFLDPQPPAYIARLYSLAVAGLSTLRDSPLFEMTRPVKIFAGMSCAKPIVYVGKGEGARLIETAQAGLVSPPENPEALARHILQIVDEPQLAQRLGENGRRYVEEHLSWSSLIQSWLESLQPKQPQSAKVPG